MSGESSSSLKDSNSEYVDIHGRDIPAVIYGKSREVAVPLSELKQTGVGIYQKSQYAKLATVDKQFDDDFHLFMLESAKSYMLMNKISFPEEQILKSINNSKKILTDKKKQTHGFLGNRVVEEKSDDEILIQVSNVASNSISPQTPSKFKRKPYIIKSPPTTSPKEFPLRDLQQVETNQNGKQKRPANNKSSPKNHETNESNNQPKQNDNQSCKLRPPKTKILEKIVLNEQNQNVHDVIVTYVDKRNCIWVRDKANYAIFDTIHKLVNDEKKFQKAAPKPWQFEKVYMTQNEGSWFRCKIHRFSPLTVFFLDYGNVVEVTELKIVSDQLAKIPCMAVRLTFRENEYIPELQDELKVKIVKQNEDGTYYVNILEQTTTSGAEETKSNTPLKFNRRPPPLCSLGNGQKVVIIHEDDGVIYLRTKECYQKLKDLEWEIEEQVKLEEKLQKVDVDQLVLVSDEDGKFHRAVVLKFVKNKVQVEFLDYIKRKLVSLESLLNINELLSKEPVTYFPGGKLKNFDRTRENCRNLLDNSIQNRTKYTVILDSSGNFDLSDGARLLSEQLQDPEDVSERIRLRDMRRYEPQIGVNSYLCGCFKDSNDIALVPSDELADHMDSVLKQEMRDATPYRPVEGEVCVCLYLDHWYRCVVTRALNREFEVLLLDFGNVELVSRDDLRKPDPEVAHIPALALQCRLVGLPDHPKVHDLLKKMIIDGELYKVEVKSISDGKCDVEIPTVYQQIRKTS